MDEPEKLTEKIKGDEKTLSELTENIQSEPVEPSQTVETSPALTEAESVAKSISKVRLTLEEIIANDNEASRSSYLSPTTSPVLSDASSVSSGFVSIDGVSERSSLHSVSSSIFQVYQNQFDPFRGIEVDEFSQVDRYGFMLNTGYSKAAASNEFLTLEREKLEQEKEKEASRALKWIAMLQDLEKEPVVNKWPACHRKFISRLEKGIPDCLRAKIWSKFLTVTGLYPSSFHVDEPVDFTSLFLKVSGFERQIDLDIERTLRDHILFKIRYSQSQISLFKILVAYSNLDPEVGYCQGMSTVAAFLLLYFEEEAAFRALTKLMQRDDLRLMYKSGFPLLFEYFWIQERLMKKFIPELAKHLEKHNISTSIYATKWYLTLFLSFPARLAARMWDIFLFYGIDVLPLIAIALLKIHSRAICKMTFEQTMQFLNRLADAPDCACPNVLVSLVMSLGRKYFGSGEFSNSHCRGYHKYRTEYEKAHPV